MSTLDLINLKPLDLRTSNAIKKHKLKIEQIHHNPNPPPTEQTCYECNRTFTKNRPKTVFKPNGKPNKKHMCKPCAQKISNNIHSRKNIRGY